MQRIALLSGFEQQLLRSLAASRAQASLHALRVATGKKISKPEHDPAGFVEISSLESRLSQIDQAINRVDAAGDFAAEAQLTVDQVRTQLETIRDQLLEDEAGALTVPQRTANQAAIDEALAAIDSLATTRLAGNAALDGSSDYRVSGRLSTQITNVDVYRASSLTLSGEVSTAAERATLTYTGAAGLTTAAATITLAGAEGSIAVTVANGQTLASLATTINASSHTTRVVAEASGNTLTLRSVDYGSAALVDVDVNSGAFALAGGDGSGRDAGVDVAAEINGESVTGEGNRISFVDNSSHVALDFAAGFTGSFATLAIADDTALHFGLTTDPARGATLGLRSLLTASQGGVSGRLSDLASGGSLAGLASNTSAAIRVVDEALSELELVEAQTDSFADITVATSSSLLSGMKTAIADTLTALNGVDDDEENAFIDYYQSLSDNAVSSLAIVTQQRQSIVSLLRSIAGLD